VNGDFEAAVVSAINLVFPESVITGYDFNFKQCLRRKLKILVLWWNKKRMNIRLTCRICATLAYSPVNKVEEDWLVFMKIFHRMTN
jgi:hypothetical protein